MEDLVICKREDLVSVADVIREASGTDDALVFPHGFVEPVAELGDRVVELGDRKTELEQQIEKFEATVTELETWKADNSLAVEVFESRMKSRDLSSMFNSCSSLTTVPLFDTSDVTDMNNMFYKCTSLTTVPLFNTSNVTNMGSMFNQCKSLTTIPLFDMRKVTNTTSMFFANSHLTDIPPINLGKATSTAQMFYDCSALTTVPSIDMRSANNASNILTNCKSLTDCYIRNIKTNLQVGSGSSYGHLLTVDSLLHLVKELRDTGSLKTLTMGNVNLEKIANTYVKLVPVTDEMRAEDDLIDEKLPFEVCESTDEGAVLITDYVLEKNWQIK